MPGISRSASTAQRGRSCPDATVPTLDVRAVQAEGLSGTRVSAEGGGNGRGKGSVTVLYPRTAENVPLGPPAGAPRSRMSFRHPEAGMATAEYAIATLAAVAFAALLVAVLGSGEVRSLLMGLIRSALTLG